MRAAVWPANGWATVCSHGARQRGLRPSARRTARELAEPRALPRDGGAADAGLAALTQARHRTHRHLSPARTVGHTPLVAVDGIWLSKRKPHGAFATKIMVFVTVVQVDRAPAFTVSKGYCTGMQQPAMGCVSPELGEGPFARGCKKGQRIEERTGTRSDTERRAESPLRSILRPRSP